LEIHSDDELISGYLITIFIISNNSGFTPSSVPNDAVSGEGQSLYLDVVVAVFDLGHCNASMEGDYRPHGEVDFFLPKHRLYWL